MSNRIEKKKLSEFGSDADIERLLKQSMDDIPIPETIDLMYQQLVAAGKLDPEKLDLKSGAFYLWFLADREKKTSADIARELGVSRTDLAIFKKEMRFIREEDLFDLCKEFSIHHPEFQAQNLLAIFRRAISLYALATGSSTVRKAARKKPSKR